MAAEPGFLRIGELSRRTGVAPELLRAWERRYGLLRPSRSSGGFRLYSPADEQRIALMREHLRRGLAAAEAARLAVDGADAPAAEHVADRSVLDADAEGLRAALDAFDERGAQRALDDLLAAFTLETVLAEVVLPYLAELGERWAAGDATVAQEHFASNVIRGRLLGLARGWDGGEGRRALLACAPGEQHDLGLIAFGLVLARRGWRITFVGPDTPTESLVEAARTVEPDLVVVTATTPKRLTAIADPLRRLSRNVEVALAGAGATAAVGDRIGVPVLAADPVGAAASLAGG
jgi:MerR family transcriptional regulator, light-induced transcriptional regulator